MRHALALLAALTIVGGATPALAVAPTGKLVMLDVDKLSNVTSKRDPDNRHLSWQELVDAGINGVHFRIWTQSGDSNAYTHSEWVNEAHQYGLWVCGGTGSSNSVADMISHVQELATMGVDFIQLDEPMGFGLTEAQYNSIRDAVRAIDPTIPVIITDVFYNDTIASWSQVDGLAQEVYIDDWYQNIDKAVAYGNAHPGQEVMMWVWLPIRLVYPEQPCTSLPDSKFNLWFNDSFDKIGKVLLFIFQTRDTAGDACSWGTDWSSRLATITAKTAPYSVAMPQWKEFAMTGANDGSPSSSVQVRSAGAGLDPASVKATYSTDGGETWLPWSDVDCTGNHATTEWQTITARNVPFQQVSSTLNKLRFKITDTYTGSYYRSARTDDKVYNVDITTIDEPVDDPDAGIAEVDGGRPGVDTPVGGGCGCRASIGPTGWAGLGHIAVFVLLLGWVTRKRRARLGDALV